MTDIDRQAPTPRDNGVSKGTVLIVDDDAGVAALFERFLTTDGFTVRRLSDGNSTLVNVAFHQPDVVLLDVLMPGLDGFEICRRLKADAGTRLTPVILVTALSDRESRIRGLQVGADGFLSKPVDAEELLTRVRSQARLKRYTDDLESAASIISTITEMVEARDGYADGHCYRMANYATALGRRLGLGPDDLQTLHRGGFLHDIGMLAISDAVLRKAGPLEPQEHELIKSHTVVGDRLCARLRSLQPVRPIIRHHHERHNGSGYPDGLAGDALPLLAAIVGIVDVFDAVTTQRPYQRAQSFEEALAVLWRQVSLGWRRHDLVSEFAALVQEGQLDTFSLPSSSS